MFGFNIHQDLPVLLIMALMAGAVMFFVRWRARKEYKEKEKEADIIENC